MHSAQLYYKVKFLTIWHSYAKMEANYYRCEIVFGGRLCGLSGANLALAAPPSCLLPTGNVSSFSPFICGK